MSHTTFQIARKHREKIHMRLSVAESGIWYSTPNMADKALWDGCSAILEAIRESPDATGIRQRWRKKLILYMVRQRLTPLRAKRRNFPSLGVVQHRSLVAPPQAARHR